MMPNYGTIPAILSPIPNPVPFRAESLMTGKYVSKMEKVAAATNDNKAISSNCNDCFGIA